MQEKMNAGTIIRFGYSAKIIRTKAQEFGIASYTTHIITINRCVQFCTSKNMFYYCSLPIFSLYPESPRWLYFKGRRKELKALLLKTASVNRRTISDHFFETLPEPNKEDENVGFQKLFSHRTLAIRTCVLYVNWYKHLSSVHNYIISK